MNRQTTLAKTGSFTPQWRTIDATDQVLGRLATKIAMLLMGKTKPIYTPHVDTGDFVVVLNAEKIRITGKKAQQRVYKTFSGHPDGLKTYTHEWMLEHKPELLIEVAVKRMLPDTTLGRHMLKKLKVYRGSEHPHQAQKPEALAVA